MPIHWIDGIQKRRPMGRRRHPHRLDARESTHGRVLTPGRPHHEMAEPARRLLGAVHRRPALQVRVVADRRQAVGRPRGVQPVHEPVGIARAERSPRARSPREQPTVGNGRRGNGRRRRSLRGGLRSRLHVRRLNVLRSGRRRLGRLGHVGRLGISRLVSLRRIGVLVHGARIVHLVIPGGVPIPGRLIRNRLRACSKPVPPWPWRRRVGTGRRRVVVIGLRPGRGRGGREGRDAQAETDDRARPQVVRRDLQRTNLPGATWAGATTRGSDPRYWSTRIRELPLRISQATHVNRQDWDVLPRNATLFWDVAKKQHPDI